MKLPVYNQKGEKIKDIIVKKEVFGVETKSNVIQEAVVAQSLNARQNIAHTKGRSDVRGGGRKPWRQKGTGRARHGSIRSPIWKGGGVTFGPKNIKNLKKKINKKVKKKALLMALSEKASAETITILDKLILSKIKTKDLVKILTTLKINEKKILLSLDKKDSKILKSAKNLLNVNISSANSLNVIDILKADTILTTVASIKKIEKTYGPN